METVAVVETTANATVALRIVTSVASPTAGSGARGSVNIGGPSQTVPWKYDQSRAGDEAIMSLWLTHDGSSESTYAQLFPLWPVKKWRGSALPAPTAMPRVT